MELTMSVGEGWDWLDRLHLPTIPTFEARVMVFREDVAP